MTKYLLILVALFFFSLFLDREAKAISMPEERSISEITPKKLDREAEILAAYLESYDSPMKNHSQDFIDAAREYNLDWRLLPAIAGVESTFGKHIPGGYNAYGWAIYTPDSRFGFKSWRDGMFVVAKGLREDYLNKGLTDPYSINKIYAASPNWGGNVTFFMSEMGDFAKKYETQNTPLAKFGALPQIAAVSGQLSLD